MTARSHACRSPTTPKGIAGLTDATRAAAPCIGDVIESEPTGRDPATRYSLGAKGTVVCGLPSGSRHHTGLCDNAGGRLEIGNRTTTTLLT